MIRAHEPGLYLLDADAIAEALGRPELSYWVATQIASDRIALKRGGEAIAWFEDVLGCRAPLTFGPFRDDAGTFIQDLLDVNPRAVVNQITLLRCGSGPSIELFDYDSPDQTRAFRKNSDYGGKHIAFYVRHIDKAVAYMESKGVEKLLGPLPVTEGPAAGQTINYFRTPFGTYIELISYPKGMAYEAPTETLLWNPRDNRP